MSQLDPVQIEALNFASGKKGVGFFLEQGLGKSLIALTEFSFLHSTGRADRMIVVARTPSSEAGLMKSRSTAFSSTSISGTQARRPRPRTFSISAITPKGRRS